MKVSQVRFFIGIGSSRCGLLELLADGVAIHGPSLDLKLTLDEGVADMMGPKVANVGLFGCFWRADVAKEVKIAMFGTTVIGDADFATLSRRESI